MATPSKGVGREATQIKPGEVRNPYGPKGKGETEDEEAGWTDDGSSTLERMRKVFNQLPSQDCGPPERELRKLLKKDSKGFVSQMVSLERAEARNQGTGRSDQNSLVAGSESGEAVTAPSPADTGSDRAEFVVDDLLTNHGQPKPEPHP